MMVNLAYQTCGDRMQLSPCLKRKFVATIASKLNMKRELTDDGITRIRKTHIPIPLVVARFNLPSWIARPIHADHDSESSAGTSVCPRHSAVPSSPPHNGFLEFTTCPSETLQRTKSLTVPCLIGTPPSIRRELALNKCHIEKSE
jgi:hypothetical protein